MAAFTAIAAIVIFYGYKNWYLLLFFIIDYDNANNDNNHSTDILAFWIPDLSPIT